MRLTFIQQVSNSLIWIWYTIHFQQKEKIKLEFISEVELQIYVSHRFISELNIEISFLSVLIGRTILCSITVQLLLQIYILLHYIDLIIYPTLKFLS